MEIPCTAPDWLHWIQMKKNVHFYRPFLQCPEKTGFSRKLGMGATTKLMSKEFIS